MRRSIWFFFCPGKAQEYKAKVMDGSECPNHSLTSTIGTPAANALDANVCRKVCQPVSDS